ncbi:MAG: hypothetical protein GY755_16850 [Chloroflexi bacterium]|nr:hypothetical protein [Chloroflexota bacterium]
MSIIMGEDSFFKGRLILLVLVAQFKILLATPNTMIKRYKSVVKLLSNHLEVKKHLSFLNKKKELRKEKNFFFSFFKSLSILFRTVLF